MNPSREISIVEAKETLLASAETLQTLKSCTKGGGSDVSIFPRHAVELHLYLSTHRAKLEHWKQEVELLKPKPANAPVDPTVHLLASHRFEMDSAVRFVEEAFIKPRRSSDSKRILEAADWYCVDTFRLFVPHGGESDGKFPVGPIVALDSQRSPAIWKETAELKIPSLFAEAIAVRSASGGSATSLPPFPVICLPSDLVGLPEYLVLLSHEVGHSVDDALGLTKAVLDDLSRTKTKTKELGFWEAWMREIVADACAVAASGVAFPIALWRFAGRRPLDRKFTESHPYPPMELRLLFLRAMLGDSSAGTLDELPGDEVLSRLPQKAEVLRKNFHDLVLPCLKKLVIDLAPTVDQERIGLAVKQLKRVDSPDTAPIPFRLLPSVFTLAIRNEKDKELRKKFRKWHSKYKKPEWIGPDSNWEFTEEMLPTLRPTLLGPDGITKYPPIVLLAAYNQISFVGGTNKWLAKAIKNALILRKKAKTPWEQIDVFFASDDLLRQLERYDKGSTVRWTHERLVKERDEQIDVLKKLFSKYPDWIKKSVFRVFDGPALFASFWDSDTRGGRVHVSAQLIGLDIGVCPATDHVWLREEPTAAYRSYQTHLGMLEQNAKVIFTLPSLQPD